MEPEKKENSSSSPPINDDILNNANDQTKAEKLKLKASTQQNDRPSKRQRLLQTEESTIIDVSTKELNSSTKEKDEPKLQWGILISQCHVQTQFLVYNKFTFGSSKGCHVRIHDYSSPIIAQILYKDNRATLEVIDSSVTIELNGNDVTEPSMYSLVNGDEITITTYRSYLSFIIELFDNPIPFQEEKGKRGTTKTTELNSSEKPRPDEPHIPKLNTFPDLSDANRLGHRLGFDDKSELKRLQIPSSPTFSPPLSPEPFMPPVNKSIFEKAKKYLQVDQDVFYFPYDKKPSKNGYGTQAPQRIYREVNPNIVTELSHKLPDEEKVLIEISQHIQKYYESKIITPENNNYNLESIRYPLSPEFLQLLKTVIQFYTHSHDKVSDISKLESISRFILLQCPEYTDILQESLLGYIAKELNINYLVFDNSEWEISTDEAYPKSDSYFLIGQPENAFPASLQEKLTHKRDTTIPSTNFRKNDRVVFVGDSYSRRPKANIFQTHRVGQQFCGPQNGMKGTVLVTYDKSAVPKVGIQFDKMIPAGNTVGQRCTNKYGFIVPLSHVELAEDSDWKELIERTAVEVLLQIATGTVLHCSSYKPWEEPVKPPVNRNSVMFDAMDDEDDYLDFVASDELPIMCPSSPQYIPNSPVDLNEIEEFVPITPSQPLSTEKPKPFLIFLKNFQVGTNVIRLKFLRKYLLSLPQTISSVFIASTQSKRPETGKRTSMSRVQSFRLPIFGHDIMKEKRTKSPSRLSQLFSYTVKLVAPKGGSLLSQWNSLIDQDKHTIIYQRNHRIIQLLIKNLPFSCEDQNIPALSEKKLTFREIRQILGLSYAHYCNSLSKPLIPEKSIINSEILSDSLTLVSKLEESEKDSAKSLKATVECDNEFEETLLADAALCPDTIGVKFSDIGSLETVKDTLYELVTLPLVRPELFRRGQLRCPCRGILLFGPPGTGKTMLAKGIASESKANFLNVSISDIVSKWYGEAEKYVKAVFSLARKLTPCVIFVDEIDALLFKRSAKSEHEVSRKMKNEFMSNWDGMSSKDTERIIVVGCTNRPFDLDEAVLRRFPRRLFIDIPTPEQRKLILQTIIRDEEMEKDFDLDKIASDETTKGFSGSDLKNLCINAAYYPLREFIDEEKEMKKNGKSESEILALHRQLRQLQTKDFVKARTEINWSYQKDTENDREMRKWNEMFGDGAKPESETLSYYS